MTLSRPFFLGGEDTLPSYLRCSGDGDSGFDAPSSLNRPLGADSAALPDEAGGLDTLLLLQGELVLQSILTGPESWLQDPLPPVSQMPCAHTAVVDYQAMLKRGLNCASLWLRREEDA